MSTVQELEIEINFQPRTTVLPVINETTSKIQSIVSTVQELGIETNFQPSTPALPNPVINETTSEIQSIVSTVQELEIENNFKPSTPVLPNPVIIEITTQPPITVSTEIANTILPTPTTPQPSLTVRNTEATTVLATVLIPTNTPKIKPNTAPTKKAPKKQKKGGSKTLIRTKKSTDNGTSDYDYLEEPIPTETPEPSVPLFTVLYSAGGVVGFFFVGMFVAFVFAVRHIVIQKRKKPTTQTAVDPPGIELLPPNPAYLVVPSATSTPLAIAKSTPVAAVAVADDEEMAKQKVSDHSAGESLVSNNDFTTISNNQFYTFHGVPEIASVLANVIATNPIPAPRVGLIAQVGLRPRSPDPKPKPPPRTSSTLSLSDAGAAAAPATLAPVEPVRSEFSHQITSTTKSMISNSLKKY